MVAQKKLNRKYIFLFGVSPKRLTLLTMRIDEVSPISVYKKKEVLFLFIKKKESVISYRERTLNFMSI